MIGREKTDKFDKLEKSRGNINRERENKEKKEELKKNADGEFIFETSEEIEVHPSFDAMGLREDLIKGKNFFLLKIIFVL
jgi:hypothetical protein